MRTIRTFLPLLFFILSSGISKAQNSAIAESLHSSGKMGAVIAVMSIIFAGIVIYLILIDRKLKRLEKEMNDKK